MTVSCGSTQPRGDGISVFFPQGEDSARGFGRFGTHFGDTTQEERQPRLPIAAISDCLEVVIVGLAVALEVCRGHGGELRWENRAGGGARVSMEFPLLAGGAGPGADCASG